MIAMARTGRAALTAALTVGVLVLAGSAPAGAETVSRSDARGDAPARIDVTRATYTHSDDHVSVVARIPRLGRQGTAALSISRFEIFEAGYVVEVVKRAGQPARAKLLYYNHFDLLPRSCDDVTGSWGHHRVTLSVARSCLTGHARDRVFTQFGIQSGSDVDRAPAVKRLRRS